MIMGSIPIALSGLTASANRLAATASNLANLRTTGRVPAIPPSQPVPVGPPGAPQVYQPLAVAQQSLGSGAVPAGVASSFVPVLPPFVQQYEPDSPEADAGGMVAAPNIEPATEIANQMVGADTYRMNLRTIETGDRMLKSLLDIRT
jgi:flagellar basal-body rod protein FlgC